MFLTFRRTSHSCVFIVSILQKLYRSQLQESFQSTYIIKCRNSPSGPRLPFQFDCSPPNPWTLKGLIIIIIIIRWRRWRRRRKGKIDKDKMNNIWLLYLSSLCTLTSVIMGCPISAPHHSSVSVRICAWLINVSTFPRIWPKPSKHYPDFNC